MSLAAALDRLNAALYQCDNLIANAHRQDAGGQHLFPAMDREQITQAAFMNMFIAWESFIEETLLALMTGSPTISGNLPTRFVMPSTEAAAGRMIMGVMQYFDFSHHDNVKKISHLFFDNAYPLEPHLSSIAIDLQDLKKPRNGCAHITSTTKRGIEALALRIFGSPQPGITVYQLITAVDPRSRPDTIYLTYRNKLAAAASLIANG